jgi:hypothetical protein
MGTSGDKYNSPTFIGLIWNMTIVVSNGTFVTFAAGPIKPGARSLQAQNWVGVEYACSCKYGDGVRYITKNTARNVAEKTAIRINAT